MKGLVIKYKIDNFSEIFSIKDWEKHYRLPTPHWTSKNRKKLFIPTKMMGCYFIYDKDYNIIYIGKSTNCIRSRLANHLLTAISVYNDEWYQERMLDKRNEACYFSYTEVDKQFVDFVERGLINKLSPKYNLEFNNTTRWQ